MKYLLLIVFLVGCSQSHKHSLEVSGFEKEVNDFELAAASEGLSIDIRDMIIQIGDLVNENGRCFFGDDETPLIVVDEFFWEYADEASKELILFHEMAHCVLGLFDHRDGVNEDGQPTSILNSSLDNFSVAYYKDHKQAYYHELFRFN